MNIERFLEQLQIGLDWICDPEVQESLNQAYDGCVTIKDRIEPFFRTKRTLDVAFVRSYKSRMDSKIILCSLEALLSQIKRTKPAAEDLDVNWVKTVRFYDNCLNSYPEAVLIMECDRTCKRIYKRDLAKTCDDALFILLSNNSGFVVVD